jgi:hypothetical protein
MGILTVLQTSLSSPRWYCRWRHCPCRRDRPTDCHCCHHHRPLHCHCIRPRPMWQPPLLQLLFKVGTLLTHGQPAKDDMPISTTTTPSVPNPPGHWYSTTTTAAWCPGGYCHRFYCYFPYRNASCTWTMRHNGQTCDECTPSKWDVVATPGSGAAGSN